MASRGRNKFSNDPSVVYYVKKFSCIIILLQKL